MSIESDLTKAVADYREAYNRSRIANVELKQSEEKLRTKLRGIGVTLDAANALVLAIGSNSHFTLVPHDPL